MRLLFLLFGIYLFGQDSFKISSGIDSPTLELNSSNKGMLVPKMNSSQINSIENPVESLLVYDNDSQNEFKYFDGCQWVSLQGTSDDVFPNNRVSYVAANETGNYTVVIESSSDITSNVEWSRSGDIATLILPQHNFSVGDAIFIRNANLQAQYSKIISVLSNGVTIDTTDSGNLCGKNALVQTACSVDVINNGNGANVNPYGNIDQIDINIPSYSHSLVLNSISIYANDQTEEMFIYLDGNFSHKHQHDVFVYGNYPLYSGGEPRYHSDINPAKIRIGYSAFEQNNWLVLKRN